MELRIWRWNGFLLIYWYSSVIDNVLQHYFKYFPKNSISNTANIFKELLILRCLQKAKWDHRSYMYKNILTVTNKCKPSHLYAHAHRQYICSHLISFVLSPLWESSLLQKFAINLFRYCKFVDLQLKFDPNFVNLKLYVKLVSIL